MKKIANLLLLLSLILGFSMCGKAKKQATQTDSVNESDRLKIQLTDTALVYTDKNVFSNKEVKKGIIGKSFSFKLPMTDMKLTNFQHLEMQLLYTHTGTGDYKIVDGDEFNEETIANNQLALFIVVGDEERGAYILADTPKTKAIVKDKEGKYSISIDEPLVLILQDEPSAELPETIKIKLKDFSLD